MLVSEQAGRLVGRQAKAGMDIMSDGRTDMRAGGQAGGGRASRMAGWYADARMNSGAGA